MEASSLAGCRMHVSCALAPSPSRGRLGWGWGWVGSVTSACQMTSMTAPSLPTPGCSRTAVLEIQPTSHLSASVAFRLKSRRNSRPSYPIPIPTFPLKGKELVRAIRAYGSPQGERGQRAASNSAASSTDSSGCACRAPRPRKLSQGASACAAVSAGTKRATTLPRRVSSTQAAPRSTWRITSRQWALNSVTETTLVVILNSQNSHFFNDSTTRTAAMATHPSLLGGVTWRR